LREKKVEAAKLKAQAIMLKAMNESNNVALAKMKEEAKILMTDMSTMDPLARAWYMIHNRIGKEVIASTEAAAAAATTASMPTVPVMEQPPVMEEQAVTQPAPVMEQASAMQHVSMMEQPPVMEEPEVMEVPPLLTH
jgi:hypothetical protein